MIPTDIHGKTILISPLNWGMGHVARCIPLIKKLVNQNNHVIVACSEIQRKIFEIYFLNTTITLIDHEGYPFRFYGNGNFIFDLLLNFKKLIKRHHLELIQVNQIIQKYEIDLVISDHRYGFRSDKCVSIFMTHQTQLPLPWYFKIAQVWHKKQLLKFDFQWIVDDETRRLAKKLSNKEGFPNSAYIGFLSRFEKQFSEKIERNKGVLLISGPSEYYPILFDRFKSQINSCEIDLIVGNEDAFKLYKTLNLGAEFHYSANWMETDEIIKKAKKIYGFCGYSTLMDLQFLNCENELIACPGQLEQLYLQKKS